MHKNEVLVFIPTYNEKCNVQKLYQEIKKYKKNVDILFCDDNSPDGTGFLLDELAKKDSSVYVIHREKKLGLGTAHIKAFEYAYNHNYKFLITMDADFTHDPAYIPIMLEKKNNSDVVIGSRYIKGGGMTHWNKLRLPFTYFWHNLIRRCLGLPYDCTGAFRLYNVEKLNLLDWKKIDSRGFSFCVESLYRMNESGFKIIEIPIKAQNRLHGKSKLSYAIMSESAAIFCRLFFERMKKWFFLLTI